MIPQFYYCPVRGLVHWEFIELKHNKNELPNNYIARRGKKLSKNR